MQRSTLGFCSRVTAFVSRKRNKHFSFQSWKDPSEWEISHESPAFWCLKPAGCRASSPLPPILSADLIERAPDQRRTTPPQWGSTRKSGMLITESSLNNCSRIYWATWLMIMEIQWPDTKGEHDMADKVGPVCQPRAWKGMIVCLKALLFHIHLSRRSWTTTTKNVLQMSEERSPPLSYALFVRVELRLLRNSRLPPKLATLWDVLSLSNAYPGLQCCTIVYFPLLACGI